MSSRKKLMFCATLVVLVTMSCGQSQTPMATPVPSNTLTATPTRTPRPTQTPHPPTPTATDPAPGPGPFQRVVSLPETLPSYPAELVQVRAPTDGSVWVITSQSVFRWDGQEVKRVHSMEEDMLADVDESGRLWLFRQDADEITAWQNGQWLTYGAETGWTSAQAATSVWWVPKPWRVSIGKDGTVWLPTHWDIRHFDGKRWTIHTREEMGFPSPESEDWSISIVHQIALVDGGAQVWVGECQYSGPGPMGSPGVRWFDGVTWRGEDAPVGPTCASVVDVDRAGNVWIGAQDVIWSYEPARQKWTSYPLPETALSGYNFTYVRDLIVDNSGDIWVYLQYCGGASCDANSKLHRIHAGEWSDLFEKHEWFMPLQQLVTDASGQGWLFWDGTVYRLEGDSPKPVAAFPALGVDVSPDGKMWAVADNALWVLEP